MIHIEALDAIDPIHAEPSPAAVAAARARLPRAERNVGFTAATGWLGAAQLLVDAALAIHLLRAGDPGTPRAVTCTAAAAPGQIGIIRVEALSSS